MAPSHPRRPRRLSRLHCQQGLRTPSALTVAQHVVLLADQMPACTHAHCQHAGGFTVSTVQAFSRMWHGERTCDKRSTSSACASLSRAGVHVVSITPHRCARTTCSWIVCCRPGCGLRTRVPVRGTFFHFLPAVDWFPAPSSRRRFTCFPRASFLVDMVSAPRNRNAYWHKCGAWQAT